MCELGFLSDNSWHERDGINKSESRYSIRRSVVTILLYTVCGREACTLSKYKEQRWIHGIKICRQAPSITHMLFVDDSYLYFKTNDDEAVRLLELLQVYEEASRKKVILLKSSVFFSSNIKVDNRVAICQNLQMNEAGEHNTYMGLPHMLGRNKSGLLGFLKEKVKRRLQSWKD